MADVRVAKAHCGSLASKKFANLHDWRLPSESEAKSLGMGDKSMFITTGFFGGSVKKKVGLKPPTVYGVCVAKK